MLPAKLVAELHDSIPPDRFYTDPVDCYAYSYDNSRKIFPPDGVLFPLTCDEIQHIVKLCNQYQTIESLLQSQAFSIKAFKIPLNRTVFFGHPILLVLHFQRLVEILLRAREDRTRSNMEPLGNTF